MNNTFAPAWDEYAAHSQAFFRLTLAALSEPARTLEAPARLLPENAPLPPVLAALVLTLADVETPVWLSPSLAGAAPWLRFHRGCPVVEDPSFAALVLAADESERPPLSALAQGTDRYPDRSATLFLGGLPDDGGQPLSARGPGIDGRRAWSGHGLSPAFLKEWAVNQAAFPLGVDVFLAGPDRLAGLPRTTILEGESCMSR